MKVINLLFASTMFLLACSSNKTTSGPETKQANPSENKPLEGTYWALTELNGKPVSAPKDGDKPSYLFLSADKKRVSLSGGCNVMGGSYELMDGNRIKFGQMMSTMMACPDMTNEDGLKKMAEMVDNYAIQGDNLSLAKARMAPVARFKAMPIPQGMK
ncbi:MAG: META domain-containing protein, partial [Chitinophagaceae bacterium]|nr:META domain-containing protein [Chitinophagaceae bacterium]